MLRHVRYFLLSCKSVYVTLLLFVLFNVTLCYIALRYLFSRNLLWFDAFHYTNSFNHELYAWRGTLKSSNLLKKKNKKIHITGLVS